MHAIVRVILVVTSLVLLFAGIGVASATDYYVATGGNNNDTGLSLSEAWATPSYAARQVQAGDTIYLADGTWYGEIVSFTNSGTSGNPITMKAYSGRPVLDGSGSGGFGLDLRNTDYITIEGLEVHSYSAAVYTQYSNYIMISDCILHDTSGQTVVFHRGTHHSTIDHCEVYKSGFNGIQIRGDSIAESNYNTIRYTDIHDCDYHNLLDLNADAPRAIKHTYIHHNTLHDVNRGSAALFVHNYRPVDTTIEDNVMYNAKKGIDGSGYIDSLIKNNEIYGTNEYGVQLFGWGGEYSDKVIFENNYVHNTGADEFYVSGSDIIYINNRGAGTVGYRFSGGGGAVRNHDGTTFTVQYSGGASVTVEYTDGRVFSVDGSGSYTTYTITSGTHTINVIGESSVGAISGTVTDTDTGLEIEGATITVEGTGRSDTTNGNGDYLLEGIPTGTYTVTCVASGYESNSEDNVDIVEDETTTVDFSLTAMPQDDTPPAEISDLLAGNPTSGSITLTWTAPGDDENTGTASQYDIRYFTSEITGANWDLATQCTGELAPQAAGTSETFTVNGLSFDTTYFFAIKTADEIPNWSDISNSPGETTLEVTYQYIWLEAEDADPLTADFEVASDTSASNDKYIWIPEETSWNPGKGSATYALSITSPGEYVIWGRVLADTTENNSFFVRIDDSPDALWTMETSPDWAWDQVNHWGSGTETDPEIDPVTVILSAGDHNLIIKQRESGTRLDRLFITNDMSYIPDEDDTTPPTTIPTPTPTPTPTLTPTPTPITSPTPTIPPTTTTNITPPPDKDGWNNIASVTVIFFRSGNGGSGVSYTEYSKTSELGPWTRVDISSATGQDAANVTDISEGEFNVTVSGEGNTTIWYRTVDDNSNVEPIKNVTVRIKLTDVQKGDVNQDGSVDSEDAAYISNHALGVEGYEEIDNEVADVNEDGIVNLADGTYILQTVQ